jgi:16S rRNA processing protein RimM
VTGAAHDRLVEIGVVARAHGVRGEVRVHLHNPASTTLQSATAVYVDGQRYAIEAARAVPRAALLRLAGVHDRDAAAALCGRAVAVARAEIPLGEGEYLAVDLVGCDAVLADGSAYGRIVAVATGLQDRLILRAGAREWQVPLCAAFLVALDLDARRVVLAPPSGLPEEVIDLPDDVPAGADGDPTGEPRSSG